MPAEIKFYLIYTEEDTKDLRVMALDTPAEVSRAVLAIIPIEYVIIRGVLFNNLLETATIQTDDDDNPDQIYGIVRELAEFVRDHPATTPN